METLIGFYQACSWENVLNSLKFCDDVQEWEFFFQTLQVDGNYHEFYVSFVFTS